MNPRLTMRRHGRAIAVVGALVAVSATTTMALVAGTAAAAPPATQPGKCIDNVNVRADANTTSKIVAVCETGKAVQVAETRNGFVHLTDLKGWAAQEYVSVNGRTPSTPASRATTTAPAATTVPSSGRASGTAPTHGRVTPGTSGNNIDPSRSVASGSNAGTDTSVPDSSSRGTGGQGTGGQTSAARSPVSGLLG